MIEVRAARPEDTAEILALFRTCFGHERSAAEWHWKYALAPHGAASWVAVADGALIAHYGGVRQECHAGGRPFVGYQGVDIMTHPDWRARVFARRGVLVRLAEAFFAAHPMDAYFGFPSQRHARLNRLLLGYEDHRPVGQLRQSVAQRDGVTGDGGAEPAEWDSLDAAALDRLWRTCRRRLALSLEKGSRYLFWRYRDRPGHRYEVLSAGGWLGRLDGIAVLALAGEEVRLLELLARSRPAEERLLAAVERWGAARGARHVVAWANPAEPLSRLMTARGYAAGPGIPCIAKLFPGPLAGADFLGAYCYRLGDYDAV